MKKLVCLSVSIILLLLGCAKIPTSSQSDSVASSPAASSQSSQNESSEPSSSASSSDIKSNSDYKYKIVDNSVTIVEYIGNAKDVVVPDKIDGYPVKVIGDSAFWGCSGIDTLKLPNSVEIIEESAFEQTSFEEFVFPPKITVINGGIFYESNIQKVVLPEHIQEIKGSAFSISALSEINIPDSVTTINEYSFEECPASLILFYDNNPLVPQYAQKYNILCFKRSEYNPVLTVDFVGGKPLNDDQNLGINQDDFNRIKRKAMNELEFYISNGVYEKDFNLIAFEHGIYNAYSGFIAGDNILSGDTIKQKLTKLAELLYQCGITEYDPKTVNTGKVGCYDKLVTAALYCRWPKYSDNDVIKGCDVRFADNQFLFVEVFGLFDFIPDALLVTGYSEQQHGIWYYPKELPEVTTEVLSFDGNLTDGNYVIKIKFTDKSGTATEKTFNFSIEQYDNVGGSYHRIILKGIQ